MGCKPVWRLNLQTETQYWEMGYKNTKYRRCDLYLQMRSRNTEFRESFSECTCNDAYEELWPQITFFIEMVGDII